MTCEEILEYVNFTVPDLDKDEKEAVTRKSADKADEILYAQLCNYIPAIEQYYEIEYKGTERMSYEWYPPGTRGELICENSAYVRKKWLRTRVRDLTAVLFLSDYQDQPPLDEDYEVYGGKLEFAQHRFGFNPKRGTLIIYPSDPHFINNTSQILHGDLYQARIQIAAKQPLIYQPDKFPGNFTQWFSNLT